MVEAPLMPPLVWRQLMTSDDHPEPEQRGLQAEPEQHDHSKPEPEQRGLAAWARVQESADLFCLTILFVARIEQIRAD